MENMLSLGSGDMGSLPACAQVSRTTIDLYPDLLHCAGLGLRGNVTELKTQDFGGQEMKSWIFNF